MPGRKARIALIGLGGVGSAVVRLLIKNPSISSLLLVDRDNISASNLSRQTFYAPVDVGLNKAETMAKIIAPLVPYEVIAIPLSVEECIEGLEDVDVFFLCVDNLEARMFVNSQVRSLEGARAMIETGSEQFLGHVLFVSSETSCVECCEELYSTERGLENVCGVEGVPRSFEQCVLQAVAILGGTKGKKDSEESTASNQLNIVNEAKDEKVLDSKPSKDLSLFEDPQVSRIWSEACKIAVGHGLSVESSSFVDNFLNKFSMNLPTLNELVAIQACRFFSLWTSHAAIEDNYVSISTLRGISVSRMAIEKKDSCSLCHKVNQHTFFTTKTEPFPEFQSRLASLIGAKKLAIFERERVVFAQNLGVVPSGAVGEILEEGARLRVKILGDKKRQAVEVLVKFY